METLDPQHLDTTQIKTDEQQQQQQQQHSEAAEEETQSASPVSLFPSFRLFTTCVASVGSFVTYMMHVNLGFAIICMVPPAGNGTADAAAAANESESDGLILDWDRSVQGSVLSSYYIGYTVSQFPANLLAQRFGARWLIGGMLILSSVSTALLPPLAQVSWLAAAVLRALTGVGAGIFFPGVLQLLAAWATPLERSKLVTFSFAGVPVGVIGAYLLSSLLCSTVGWQYIFYSFGATGMVWTVVWLVVAYDTPELHPWVSEAEKQHIQASLTGQVHEKGERSLRLPVLRVATSAPFWGILLATATYDWGAFLSFSSFPTYLQDVYKMSVAANALWSCLPYAGFFVVQLATGWLADWLQTRQLLSTGATRKVMTCVCMLMPAAALCAVGFVDTSQWQAAVALLVVGMSFRGAISSAMPANMLDIAPRFAGSLFAFCNTLAAATGIVSPNVTALLVSGEGDAAELQAQWRRVLLLAAGMYALGAAAFVALGSGDVQPWAKVGGSELYSETTTNNAEA